METTWQKIKRISFVVYMVVIHGTLAFFLGDFLIRRYVSVEPLPADTIAGPDRSSPIPTPLPVPETFVDPQANTNTAPTPINPPANRVGLLIPVVGIKPDQLTDTFSSSRSEGERFHDAIDIMAPAGTPVVAAADGEIVRFFDSERGGITIYQLTEDRRYMLYYAHLQRRADEIAVGSKVRQGMTIGFVGDTGNAGPGNYHLHFSIAIVTDPQKFSEGTYINPYPLLREGRYPSD